MHQGANQQANKRQHSFFRFATCPQRFVNSLAHRELWLESFFLQSLVWSMSTLLREEQRALFVDFLKEKISKNLAADESAMKGVTSPGSAGAAPRDDMRRFRSELSEKGGATPIQ